MSDQDPLKPKEAEPKKYPFWPDLLNGQFETGEQQQTNKFAWLRRALIAIGKLATQTFIFWMVFIIFLIFLIPSIRGTSIWGNDQNYLAVQEIVKLITFTISVFIAVKIFGDIEIVDTLV